MGLHSIWQDIVIVVDDSSGIDNEGDKIQVFCYFWLRKTKKNFSIESTDPRLYAITDTKRISGKKKSPTSFW